MNSEQLQNVLNATSNGFQDNQNFILELQNLDEVVYPENKKSRREDIDPSNYITENPISKLCEFFNVNDLEEQYYQEEDDEMNQLNDDKILKKKKTFNQSLGAIQLKSKCLFTIKDSNELSIKNLRSKKRDQRQTIKNIQNMQAKNDNNPFRPGNSCSQYSKSSVAESSNSVYESNKKYNLDVKELFDSTILTQRSHLSQLSAAGIQKKMNVINKRQLNLNDLNQRQLVPKQLVQIQNQYPINHKISDYLNTNEILARIQNKISNILNFNSVKNGTTDIPDENEETKIENKFIQTQEDLLNVKSNEFVSGIKPSIRKKSYFKAQVLIKNSNSCLQSNYYHQNESFQPKIIQNQQNLQKFQIQNQIQNKKIIDSNALIHEQHQKHNFNIEKEQTLKQNAKINPYFNDIQKPRLNTQIPYGDEIDDIISSALIRQSINKQNQSSVKNLSFLKEDHENLSSSDEKMIFQKNDIQQSSKIDIDLINYKQNLPHNQDQHVLNINFSFHSKSTNCLEKDFISCNQNQKFYNLNQSQDLKNRLNPNKNKKFEKFENSSVSFADQIQQICDCNEDQETQNFEEKNSSTLPLQNLISPSSINFVKNKNNLQFDAYDLYHHQINNSSSLNQSQKMFISQIQIQNETSEFCENNDKIEQLQLIIQNKRSMSLNREKKRKSQKYMIIKNQTLKSLSPISGKDSQENSPGIEENFLENNIVIGLSSADGENEEINMMTKESAQNIQNNFDQASNSVVLNCNPLLIKSQKKNKFLSKSYNNFHLASLDVNQIQFFKSDSIIHKVQSIARMQSQKESNNKSYQSQIKCTQNQIDQKTKQNQNCDDNSFLSNSENIQFKNLLLEHENFTTFRIQRNSKREERRNSKRVDLRNQDSSNEESKTIKNKFQNGYINLQNSFQQNIQIQDQTKQVGWSKNDSTITKDQKNMLISLLRGYKLRKILRTNKEIQNYISDIKKLQNLKNSSLNKQECLLLLKTKIHLFIHTLEQFSKLKKQSKREKKKINDSTNPDQNFEKYLNKASSKLKMSTGNDYTDKLMRRYLKNSKNKSVNIAFCDLYDSQSRYKILPKKPEFKKRVYKQENIEQEMCYSDISFQINEEEEQDKSQETQISQNNCTLINNNLHVLSSLETSSVYSGEIEMLTSLRGSIALNDFQVGNHNLNYNMQLLKKQQMSEQKTSGLQILYEENGLNVEKKFSLKQQDSMILIEEHPISEANDDKILLQEESPLLFELYDLNIDGTEETENSQNGLENQILKDQEKQESKDSEQKSPAKNEQELTKCESMGSIEGQDTISYIQSLENRLKVMQNSS